MNGHPETAGRPKPPAEVRAPRPPAPVAEPQMGTRNLLEQKGPQAVADWMRAQRRVLVTDTTMRDGHQSLLATRMRSIDMIRVAPAYAANMGGLFSVECWGGATFDVAYRFLQECPWQRLRDLRAAMPNVMTQMLLRGSNGVGYTNYPDNVVQAFVAQAARTGVDVFRVFDSLNWVENMRVAMDAVVAAGKASARGRSAIPATSSTPPGPSTTSSIMSVVGKELQDGGRACPGAEGHGGPPETACGARCSSRRSSKRSAFRSTFTRTTPAASQAAAVLKACRGRRRRGADAALDVDVGSDLAALNLNSLVEALRHSRPAKPAWSFERLTVEWPNYWEGGPRVLRRRSKPGIPGQHGSDVWLQRNPRGAVHESLGSRRKVSGPRAERWHGDGAKNTPKPTQMLGDIVKVTPSSKVVGDMALMMVAQGLTRAQVEDPGTEVAFPDSVVDMLKGNLGQPHGGWPPAIQRKVLKGEPAMTARPGAGMPPVDLDAVRAKVTADLGQSDEDEDRNVDDEDLNGYLMYPKVFMDYRARHRIYGPVRTLPTRTFFYGMEPGEEITAEIDPGKTLELRLQAVGDTTDDGDVRVFFELNGQPRVIRVPNRAVKAKTAARPKAAEATPATSARRCRGRLRPSG